MLLDKKKASLLAGTIMATSLIAAPAMAQDDPTMESGAAEGQGDLIVVTGSRIARQNVDTAAPIAVVDNEEFELSGTVNVENVINQLPQVIPGFTSNSNNPGTGTSTLNLRGLGSVRTMVLVNGRRWMFYDTNQIVDLNTIPQFLLDNVDVVTGGASAVYGSDALAGVVNFQLRHVDGVEVGGQYSITDEGDADRYEIHGAIGTEFADGRGRATVFAEYYNRDSLFQGDRAFSTFALSDTVFGPPLQQGGSSTIPQGRVNFSPSVTVRPAFDADGDGEIDGDDPMEAALNAPLAEGLIFDDAVFDAPGDPRARAGDVYNYAPVNYLQLPQERYLLGGYAEYEWIDGGHEVYGEVSYVNNRVDQALAATPVTGTYNIDIDTASQFLSDDAVAELELIDQREAEAIAARQAYNDMLGYCGPDDEAPDDGRPCFSDVNLYTGDQGSPTDANQLGVVRTSIQRRTVETGLRENLDERNAFRVLGGFRGPIGSYLNYDAYYMYARTRNAQVQQGNISRSAFQAGLDGTGTPINIFGPDTLTPGQIDAISILAQNGDVSELQVANAAISGTFGEFALGDAEPVGFALGGEYRKVSSQFIPDTALSSGDVIGFNAGDATEGTYDVKEVFAEVAIPIEFGDSRIEITGAGRYSDYSLEAVGGVWTYAGGIEFYPIPDIGFRGQYQRAIRAPNVAELFQGQAIGFPGAIDPCGNQDFLDSTPGAAEVCVATGVPQGNLGNGAVVQLNPQIPALFGGNPDLQEESSDSWTAGVVLQPSFLPGFTATIDYFDIVIEDAISVAGGSLQGLFNLCYRDVQDVTSPACTPFVGIRNSDGAITVDAPPLVSNANLAELGVSGVDFQFNYNTTIPFSLLTDTGEQDFNLSFLGTWTEESYFIPVATLDDIVECAGEFAGRCGEPTPSFKWTARASFVDGPLTTSFRWRHLSAVDDNDDDVNYAALNGIERIGAYDLLDVTLSYDLLETATLTVGVRNLFDTLPGTPEFDENGIVTNRPNSLLLGDNQEQANTYPSTYDVLGRDFFASVLFRF